MAFFLVCPGLFCQEASRSQTIPGILLQPGRGEAPRYPKDLVIGELGRGDAPDAAYQFALGLLSTLVSASTEGNNDAPVFAGLSVREKEGLLETIGDLEPRNFRLGGGKTGADGSVSFLVRFIGTVESITGELFLRREESEDLEQEANWVLDALVLEDKVALSEIRDSYRYDFSPYERFY